ncbi:MAG: GNAT family N-acetyltransferase [Ruminococcaceae bacterium]|jgi:RimJ/RimL family protein N-acetyltransferase|nr:GNAT family N-acetyltransferase [Oscillospiraceae bacterium]
MIEIKETTIKDIDNIKRLWADGDVMRFVGFPDGLNQTSEEMKNWFRRIESNRPVLNHYSIFEDGNYCGESFYEIDAEHQSAALDIKLFGFARGRGIATAGLSYAIKEAFQNGAEIVWVDPNPENMKAIALYERLGFQQKDFPEYLISKDEEQTSIYMELSKS